jgi:hypothetical protein
MSNRKEKGYSHKKADARKVLKREQAEDRQAKCSSLTRAERIAEKWWGESPFDFEG